MKRKNRILTVLAMFSFFICITLTPQTNAKAAFSNEKQVDGSYLTSDSFSMGKTSNELTKGVHLMDGECSITNAGIGRIYTYAATTANHKVDYALVIIYVERYLEDVNAWGHVDAWSEEVTDDYYVATSKSLEVEPGYYYRVRAEHIVFVGDESEETASATDGIFVD